MNTADGNVDLDGDVAITFNKNPEARAVNAAANGTTKNEHAPKDPDFATKIDRLPIIDNANSQAAL